MHNLEIIEILAGAFFAAFVLGYVSTRLKLSPIVGYLLDGVIVGPHTPGLMVDPDLASQLAEIGVILLMFGVGLHLDILESLGVTAVFFEEEEVAKAMTKALEQDPNVNLKEMRSD